MIEFEKIKKLPLDEKIKTINEIRLQLHEISPFKSEPVDCVIWVKKEELEANNYNPNKMDSTEKKLLEHSILVDGFTQPIVVWAKGKIYEIVDGFHRSLTGNNPLINSRLNGYLPVSLIKKDRTEKKDRISATIRHNRARGKHQVTSMTNIVLELKKRNWSDQRICKELGMCQDEVLRLNQVGGLTDLYKDYSYSESLVSEINSNNS